MERELYTGKNIGIIRRDDLIFDGKNIIIPKYWVDSLCDYLDWCERDVKQLSEEADYQDYKHIKSFLSEVRDWKKDD